MAKKPTKTKKTKETVTAPVVETTPVKAPKEKKPKKVRLPKKIKVVDHPTLTTTVNYADIHKYIAVAWGIVLFVTFILVTGIFQATVKFFTN